MIELKIKITPKQFELANYILGQAIGELKAREVSRGNMDLTVKQVDEAEKLRIKLVNAFMEAHKDD